MAYRGAAIAGGVIGVALAAAGLAVNLLPKAGQPTAAPAGHVASTPAAIAPAAAPSPQTVAVTVTAAECQPADLSATAGPVTFRIVNSSSRALEWEILKGVMVVDERENIAPGFTQTLTTTLDPGEYDVTCGLLSNPKGRLHVAAAAGAAPPSKPSPFDLVGPMAEYKVYVTGETGTLVERTRALVAAVKAGKLDEARALYADARVPYERIEPIAELFSDLDASIDSRADDHDRKEADPGFTGFHRLEYGLFDRRSTDGLAPVADRLMADVTTLQTRIQGLAVPPAKMVGGAASLIEEVAATKISGEEDRYSRTDLYDFQANVDGARKIVDLLQPLVDRSDAALTRAIAGNLATVDGILAKYRRPAGGFAAYDSLTEADRTALKGPVNALAEDLSRLRGTLGLS